MPRWTNSNGNPYTSAQKEAFREEFGIQDQIDDLQADVTAVEQDVDAVEQDVAQLSIANVVVIADVAYEPVAEDNGKILYFTSDDAITVTIQAGLPEGFSVALVRGGAGSLTVADGTDVTINAPSGANQITETYGIATLILIGADTFLLSGAIS